MKEDNQQRPVESAPTSLYTTATLLLTMADTTWRMVVPTAVLAVLAVMADLQLTLSRGSPCQRAGGLGIVGSVAQAPD